MEEVPDMDDLLDEMESDLIRKSRINQTPLLPPNSIGMLPRGIQKNIPQKTINVAKFVVSDDMNENMEGHINIIASQLPSTFQPKCKIISRESEDENECAQNVFNKPINVNDHKAVHNTEKIKAANNFTEVVNSKTELRQLYSDNTIPQYENEPKPELEPEQEPEEVSELEGVTLIPETQIISNLNETDRGTDKIAEKTIELDTEMEDMLEYLNNADEVDFQTNRSEERLPRNSTGCDPANQATCQTLVSEFAENLSKEVMHVAMKQRTPYYDYAVDECCEANDLMSAISGNTRPSLNTPNTYNVKFLSELENNTKKENPLSLVEERESTVEQEKFRSASVVSEPSTEVENVERSLEKTDTAEKYQLEEVTIFGCEHKDTFSPKNEEGDMICDQVPDLSECLPITAEREDLSYTETIIETEVIHIMEHGLNEENVIEMDSRNSAKDSKEPVSATSSCSEKVVDSLPVTGESCADELAVTEEGGSGNINYEHTNAEVLNESMTEENMDDIKSHARFDSSIATVHVLHESDSDESGTVRRERRLTESELQLGKTSPYWIPDSECPLCMLCNAKFTIITRRHHCRACGRVLCGSCCNEKAILDYLHEEGKKSQSVRVCKPCFSMLARIEAHEQEEQRRRESIAFDQEINGSDSHSSATTAQPSLPRGVLKTRLTSNDIEQDGAASTSTQAPPIPTNASDLSRRSVMFRDGVRPGAPADEENQEEERSTALKPKKKSRKRTSVVKRIAELRMEDELACALPKKGTTKILIVKPDSEQPKFEDASGVLEKLCNFSVVTIILKKNLNCNVQIFNNPNFGLVWVVSTQGFAQIGLDELLFSWTLNDKEKQKLEGEEPELDEETALSFLPISVLQRISIIYTCSTEQEYAGVRRVNSRLMHVHTVTDPVYPLTKHIMFFRPTVQVGLENMRIPINPFLIACFLHDDELSWATALPNRLLYKLGEKYNVFPTPFVNYVGRPPLYSTNVSGTVLKVFTDFRSWSYRMRHIPGCTVTLTNEKTVIRIPKSTIKELKDVLNFSRSMVAWSCDLHQEDDSVLVCEETDAGLYSTQVFARYIGRRESTSASFVILDGGSKVNSLQVNVVEDGVAIRLQSERLETILNAINDGQDVVESWKDMEFRVEFVDDGDWIFSDNDYYPKSQIDGLYLINKFQYGLSLERALTQVLQIQAVSDYGVRLSHVYNLGNGRLQPEEEPKIYGMVEIAARECVNMLEPHIQLLICAGIGSVSIRLFVSPYEFEYDVSRWLGLEEENDKYKQSLDQLIPMLYNMIEYVPNGFEVEFVLSIVSTRALPI